MWWSIREVLLQLQKIQRSIEKRDWNTVLQSSLNGLVRRVKFRGFPVFDWNDDWASTKEFDKSCSLREHLCSLGKASSGLNCTPVNTTSGIRIFKRNHWSSNVSSMFMVVYYLPYMLLFDFMDLHMLWIRIYLGDSILRISPFQLHDQLPGRPKTRQRAVETLGKEYLGKHELLHVLYNIICSMYE